MGLELPSKIAGQLAELDTAKAEINAHRLMLWAIIYEHGGKIRVSRKTIDAADPDDSVECEEDLLSGKIILRSKRPPIHRPPAFTASDPLIRVLGADIPDGTYEGNWSGYEVRFEFDGKVCRATTIKGVRGLNVPCEITVQGGHITVQPK